jgi:S-DNA-T family DNA segregation ATPase FtsK/SpoIIIE
METEIAAKRHELVGFVIFLSAVFIFLCLVSYNPGDASFNVLTYKPGAENRIGKVGAYTSDLLFQVLGLSAFLLLLPLMLLSWRLVRGRRIEAPYMRAGGFLALLCVFSTSLQIFPVPLPSVNFRPGGVTGVLLYNMLLPNLNLTGTILLLFGIFVVGLLAFTRLSLGSALSQAAREEASAGLGLWERFRGWRERRKPVRTVVNIKPPSPPPLEITPRPIPIKPAPVAPPVPREEVSPPIVRQSAPEPVQSARVEDPARPHKFLLPPLELLAIPDNHVTVDEVELMDRARQLAEKCAEFDTHGSITQIHPGPVVTTFEFKPDAGVKYSRVTNLVDDLCLGIKAESIRIDRLPGKATVGIEVPNTQRETIYLRELIESDVFRKSQSKLTLALGKLINGTVYVTELNRMPHLLIAGATGAGKSVALNCMINSILYKASPEEVKFILIDPKRLELGIYADIPHLLTPIVTDPKKAANALRWATSEMEERYRNLARRGVRNIDQYNTLLRSTGSRQLSLIDGNDGHEEIARPLPYLVLVIDELADLMMVSSREVEESISRLAAMARAVGIHLILATQRPSVDVITGVIKANFPCRIAFKVATKVDSRTILDANGAEQLLGNGDMLFIPPGSSRITRVHGPYLSEKEAQDIVRHLNAQGSPAYNDSVLTYGEEEVDEEGNPVESGGNDPLYNDALRVVVNAGKASTSLLQRRLSIGYGRAAKLIDLMYKHNLVGAAEGSKPREVLVGLDFLDRLQ